MDFFKRLFCEHEYEYLKEINISSYINTYKRIYICPKCLKKRVIKY
jgi:hypothetical protein